MIPREILKKIRQIKIRTNCVVTETLAGASLQPPAQLRRIPRVRPDGNDFYFGVRFVDNEINRVRPAVNTRLAAFATGFGKSKWLGSNRRNHCIHFKGESNPESCSLIFMPSHGFPKFKRGFEVMDDPKTHFLYLASVSSRSCSHGMPRPGFFSASSARRSSSAICSGVSVSSKSSSANSRICSKASRRSSNGSLQNCSTTCAALMELNLTAVKHFASA